MGSSVRRVAVTLAENACLGLGHLVPTLACAPHSLKHTEALKRHLYTSEPCPVWQPQSCEVLVCSPR